MSKVYEGQKGRKDLVFFEPEKIKVVEDENDPRFDPRSRRKPQEHMVLAIMAKGVILPLVIYPEGDDVYCGIGHQRRINAIEANKRLVKAGEKPILVPCIWRKEDDVGLFVIRQMENNLRTGDDLMERARNMAKLENMGGSVKDLAMTFGCTAQTVRNTLALLKCDPKVQRKVSSGDLPAITAAKLSKLPREKQVERLDKMLKDGATRGRRAAAAARTGRTDTKVTRMARRDFVENWRTLMAAHPSGAIVCDVLDVVLGQKKVEEIENVVVRDTAVQAFRGAARLRLTLRVSSTKSTRRSTTTSIPPASRQSRSSSTSGSVSATRPSTFSVSTTKTA